MIQCSLDDGNESNHTKNVLLNKLMSAEALKNAAGSLFLTHLLSLDPIGPSEQHSGVSDAIVRSQEVLQFEMTANMLKTLTGELNSRGRWGFAPWS